MEALKEKSTDDLRQELMRANNLDSYLRGNRRYFSNPDVGGLLSALYEKKSFSKASLARTANMSDVYLHQVFSGRRTPSRDRLLCLCIALGATLEETQLLLKEAACAQLYPKNRRDAIISYGIVHHMELEAINDKLFAENEKALF